jgi:Ni/Co efflux regulator RcnB
MKRIVVLVLVLSLAALSATAQKAGEQEAKKEKKAAAAKEERWHGIIVRSNAANNTMTVRKGNIEKTVVWQATTKFTKDGNKPAEVEEFTDGSDVIVLGKYDEKARLVATRIDLWRPK